MRFWNVNSTTKLNLKQPFFQSHLHHPTGYSEVVKSFFGRLKIVISSYQILVQVYYTTLNLLVYYFRLASKLIFLLNPFSQFL